MFAKVFTQILDSSLAEDYQVRLVFEDFLKLANVDGVVDMTIEAIVRRTNVPADIVRRGIVKLESPDPTSRNPDFEGRRIVRLDEHREWGWRIVSYTKYREIRSESDRRRTNTPNIATGFVYFLRSAKGVEHPIKIGFSANPWARAKELNTGSHDEQELLGYVKGTPEDEREWHERFDHLRMNGEWFRPGKDLLEAIDITTKDDVVLRISKQKQTEKKKQKEIVDVKKEEGTQKRPACVTLEEVILQGDKSGLPKDECEKFFNYYESNGWKVGKNKMQSMPHALANWAKNWRQRIYGNNPPNPNRQIPSADENGKPYLF